MQAREITEILKVFEKRITTLEQRVAELENEQELTPHKNEDSQDKSLDSSSVTTTPYNLSPLKAGKLTYTKQDIASLKLKKNPGRYRKPKNLGFSDLQKVELPGNSGEGRELTLGSHQQRNLFSVKMNSVLKTAVHETAKKVSPKAVKGTQGAGSVTTSISANVENKASASGRSSKSAQGQIHSGRSITNQKTKVDTAQPAPSESVDHKEEPPKGKTELHYDLLVQFPPDCNK